MGKAPKQEDSMFNSPQALQGPNLQAGKPAFSALAPRQFGQGGSQIKMMDFSAQKPPAAQDGRFDMLLKMARRNQMG